MQSCVTRHGDVEIAYEDFGEPSGRPLLLISGLDSQMIGWPDGFCEALAAAGLHVVRYDHRDAGLSTHFTGKKKAYELTDMLDDMTAVLEAMGWQSANLVGISMGGGLAQFAALLRPERVRTVTAISAIPQYGQPIRLFRYIRFPGPFKLVFRRYGDSPEDKQRMLTDITRLTEAKSLPLDDEWVSQTAAESLRRHAPDRYARSRQLAAGFAAKLPPGGISRITQPVLVLNGDEDPIVRPAAGRTLARAVPHGRFVLMHRMGHMFSRPLWPGLVSEIDQHAT
ncbi:MAG: alpha/beta fold hydrolase [Nocardiopsaceae bacterium]|nr:alpha/beta fold hydrolase [Nocardiopsaceae bacterium]